MLVGLAGIKASKGIDLDLDTMSQVILVCTSTLSSLLPDIDHKGSYIGRRAKVTSKITSSIFKHRGVTHSPVLVSIFMLILNFFITNPMIKPMLWGIYLGIMSHIFLDMVTKGGIPLLYPLSKKKYSLTKIKTGSFIETIIMVAMIAAIIILIGGNICMKNLIGL
jgi:inner membrane protein